MRKLSLFIIGLLSTSTAFSQTKVFLYSPGEKQGLHAALKSQKGEWQDVGQLCASDYSRWGTQKRMYSPMVLRADNGTWRAVWQVNDESPCIAVAYSDDLITWRPQDYPRTTVGGCFRPVVTRSDQGFTVYFQTRDGQLRSMKASYDFRHFTTDQTASTAPKELWKRDSVSVGGKRYGGQLYELTDKETADLRNFFAEQKVLNAKYKETMRDDGKTYAHMKEANLATLTVRMADKKHISDKLMGVFFEDISHAADGGLYAELVQNRDFEYSAKDRKEWTATTAWQSSKPIEIGTDNPLSVDNPHYAVVGNATLYNEGWDGTADTERAYYFSMFARNITGSSRTADIALVTDKGKVLKSGKITIKGDGWTRYEIRLTSKAVPTKANCRLRLTFSGKGSTAIDMVSLFPVNTFKGRRNGLRRDLAEAIAALKPKFMRFPGGCLTHGDGIDNIYHWQESIGKLQDRKPDRNLWGYHQTKGLGFYEYFQFCEDIGAEPLPVLAAGVPCQNSGLDASGYGGQQGGISMDKMPEYCQEILNLIEWANGDPSTSKWARMRAEAGHPAPFNLKYIGIGNEDIISIAFEERYVMIANAIKAKYPNIQICGTVGPFHSPSSDYIEGWRFANKYRNLNDLVDEHYYESTGWFMNNRHYYDNYDRKASKVYLGEYASRGRKVENALAEALYLCDIERNGDVVSMTSYAPLLARDKRHNWNPDMIYFGNGYITLTPSYETQRLFSLYGGDTYVASSINATDEVKHRTAASVVTDSRTCKTYLKAVNALPVPLRLKVDGISIPSTAKAEGFTGKPTDGSITKLTDIKAIDGTLTLPPYSMIVTECAQ